jgi:hypothetical protein
MVPGVSNVPSQWRSLVFFDALRDYYQWLSPTGIKKLKNLDYLLKLLLFGLTMSNC